MAALSILFLAGCASSTPVPGPVSSESPEVDTTPSASPSPSPQSQSHTIVYRVSSDHPRADVDFLSPRGGVSTQTTLKNASVPLSRTFRVRGPLSSFGLIGVTVGSGDQVARVSCSVAVDGQVVSSQDQHGYDVLAHCGLS